VLVALVLVIVPNLVVVVIAALSLAHLRSGSVPVFVCVLAPVGVLAIRRVHAARARWVLRRMGAPGH
jgi:hypothetical protein